ncbi:hypothetical protein ACFFIF_01770 [Vagococcus entomophilus]|uniref:hypothetical protein n=1 Tax=Vagococcus entomophilus TaxID=1160095 RepID=UPI0014746ECC|nr:hypothetical protein [Vagococcus entomophilus]
MGTTIMPAHKYKNIEIKMVDGVPRVFDKKGKMMRAETKVHKAKNKINTRG